MANNSKSFKSRSFKFIFIIAVAGVTLCLNSTPVESKKQPSTTREIHFEIFDKKFSDHASVYARSKNVLEATISITSILKNMKSDRGSPAVLKLNFYPGKPLKLINYFPTNRNWGYRYRYKSAIGHIGGKPDLNYIYALPYERNKTYKIEQGAHGKGTHHYDYNQFAIDFEMPVGSTICSARPGRVIAIKQDSKLQGHTKEFKNAGNHLIVRHSDGTYGLYWHLKQKGNLVPLGSTVSAGQAIALSGNTGFTNGAHLHFCVATVVMKSNGPGWLSIPIKFATARGIVENLREKELYYHPGVRTN